MSELMKKGAKVYITEDDLLSLILQDESATLWHRLQNVMQR